MIKICVRVPATTANLGPGFDALGMALDIWNRFDFTVDPLPAGAAGAANSRPAVTVACEGEGAGELPGDEENLIYKAFCYGMGEVPPLRSVHLRVENNVPLSSGLGSSATAIVGGLAAARALRGDELSWERVIRLATDMEGHPDNVAPAVLGGMVASAVDADGRVESISVQPPEELRVCIAVPDFYLTTRQARGRLPERVTRADAVYNLSRAALWVAAMAVGRLEALGIATQDALHQPYRAELIPGLEDVFAAARAAGALGVALSGSGPSVAAFCRQQTAEVVGEAMRRTFRKVGVTARIFQTRPARSGVQVKVMQTTHGDVGERVEA